MKNRDLVYRTLEMIEENIRSDINVYSVSQQFGFSLYYFSRLFKGVTGYSLQKYILSRKISESYNDLLQTDRKIVDIALDYGFSTHESFSRAFRNVLGINPSQIRQHVRPGIDDMTNLILPLTKEKIESKRTSINQKPEFVKLDSIKLAGIPFYYDLTSKRDLSQPWATLISNVSLLQSRIVPEKYFQLQYWFAEQDPGFFFFFIAAQVEDISDIPIQFTAKMIPEQTYLKFLHIGKSASVSSTYRYIYNTYLPDSEYRLPHLYNFEYYGDEYKGPFDDRSVSEIYIPVEARKKDDDQQ